MKNNGLFTLSYTVEIACAHFLPEYQGKCSRVHGHNYLIEMEVKGNQLDNNGMLIDFGVLKAAMAAVGPDHQPLNEWMDLPPSTENVARELFHRLRDYGIPLSAITVAETTRGKVRYEEPDLDAIVEVL